MFALPQPQTTSTLVDTVATPAEHSSEEPLKEWRNLMLSAELETAIVRCQRNQNLALPVAMTNV